MLAVTRYFFLLYFSWDFSIFYHSPGAWKAHSIQESCNLLCAPQSQGGQDVFTCSYFFFWSGTVNKEPNVRTIMDQSLPARLILLNYFKYRNKSWWTDNCDCSLYVFICIKHRLSTIHSRRPGYVASAASADIKSWFYSSGWTVPEHLKCAHSLG